MLPPSATKHEYHEATKHSVLSVQLDPNYVDARTQPIAFKTYPQFFRRFPLNPNQVNPSQALHQFLSLTSAITYQKQYRDGTHSLRVQPSAGALYPTELYVQLRGVHGILDGIYHLEPQTSSLTLLYELIDDGLEGYFDDARLIKDCIFLVSCVYFRSSWKYKNRSLRYCFLDSGHHLGAIEAAAYVLHYPYQVLFDFNQIALNDDLGFETKEFVTAIAIVGKPNEKTVRRLRSPLPVVSGTDYFEPNRFIEAGYKETLVATPQTHIYLAATALNLGCSGIGAFYDDETQAFLGTDHAVLYAIAIGQTGEQKHLS